MNIFITATDTNVGKSYISRGIVDELTKMGKKTAYFKPFQSGVVENEPSDVEIVTANNPTVIAKNSYITSTPCTPSISAKIDNIKISIEKVVSDYKELDKNSDIVVVEGSGGLFVPVNETTLMSDVIKSLNMPVVIVARPDLGTINHTILTIYALKNLGIKILGVIISNYPNTTDDPAITTAPELIEQFGNIKILDIIKTNSNDFSKVVKHIL